MVSLKNVTKKFGAKTVVKDLSFGISRGEFLGLLGPNGAGKTTTINMIIGALSPDAGEVMINGTGSPRQMEVRRLIGIVPQTLALYENLTAIQNLQFFSRLYATPDKDHAADIERALSIVNLSERRGDRVKTFSGGMKRRLNIAIALLHNPSILVLDEPTVGVDPQSRNAIFECLFTMKRQGCTILLTSHYIEEAQQLCDSVAIMDEGRILCRGSVDEVITRHGGLSTLAIETVHGALRIETGDPVKEIVRIHSETPILSLKMESPNLEKAFLNITGKHLRD